MTLQEFFSKYPKAAIAFSGGVDSAYLLYIAKQYAADVRAYFVKSEFQPQFELDDAIDLAHKLSINLKVLELSVLSDSNIKENPYDRCYYCKKAIFQKIKTAAIADGYSILLDGTNASDDADDRPGMKALQELQVLSPLRICGLSKKAIRHLSKEACLNTWDKPAYACLATRIPTKEAITLEKLLATEKAECYLASLGFSDFRIRSHESHARIQVRENQLELVLKHRKDILDKLKELYKTISLDLEVRE